MESRDEDVGGRMEFLKCKACGCDSMVPMDVKLLDESEGDQEDDALDLPDYLNDVLGDDQESDVNEDDSEGEESRFYSCHVCGDNWLSIRRRDDEGDSKVTFIHQMGVQPILRRVAHLPIEMIITDRSVDHWSYFLDEDEVAEGEWLNKLEDRRKVLKAICSN